MIILIFISIPCLTVIIAVGLVVRAHVLTHQPSDPPELRAAKAATAIELQKWKQDWILDQRGKGQHPQLPPGTQEVLR